MTSPRPVTSANMTERATGLAELIVAVSTAPLAVRTPNGTPPLASGVVAIHSVSARPSLSTSIVGFDCAPAGIARPTPGQPAFPPAPDADAGAAEDVEAEEDDDELPATDAPPPEPPQAASSRAAAIRTGAERAVLTC